MEFDLVKTMAIMGNTAVTKATNKTGFTIGSFTGDNKIEFCLEGEVTVQKVTEDDTAAPSSAAAENGTAAPARSPTVSVSLLHGTSGQQHMKDALAKELDAVIIADDSDTMVTAFLTGDGEVVVYSLPEEAKFQTARMEASDVAEDLGLTEENVRNEAEELLRADPIQDLYSGGGTCRFCVDKCPEGT